MSALRSIQEQQSTSRALRVRAHYRERVRSFFAEKGVLEVDTPYLNPAAQIDAHIEPVKTELGYLPTSPEHYMKRLIACGAPDIYQICKAFRKNEVGPIHRPEFTMIEWYRLDTTFNDFLAENLDLISLFLPELPTRRIPYDELIMRYNATPCDDLSWIEKIEPHLGRGELTVVTDFPPEMAALSRIENGHARRFEIFFEGIELANGFHELNDPEEQMRRYRNVESDLPLDKPFIACVKHLPDNCYGIALGFDRLVMLAEGEKELRPALDNWVAPSHTE